MVRKLSLAIAIALGVTPLGAIALGLGDIHTKSALNQYFKADIELLSVAKDELEDITVELASETAFKTAGVERPFFLSKLKFTPMQLPDGSTVVRVSSSDPIREPFLDFLIELNWPNGRLLREYTVLLDPPVTLDRRPAPVQQPGTQMRPFRGSESAPAVARSSASDYSWADEGSATEYGPTRRNDTLWGIAEKVRYQGTTMEQMMISLFRENPHAFIGNNVNNLREGEILRLPSRDQVMRLGAAEARTAFWGQMNVWRAERAETPAAPSQGATVAETAEDQAPATSGGAQARRPGAELKIASARPEGEGEAGPGEGDDPAQVISKLQQDLVAAEEAQESALAEGRELQSRVQDLESQLADLQRLLTLKSDQLAKLQAAVATGEETVVETDRQVAAATEEEGTTAAEEGTTAAEEEAVAAAEEEAVAAAEEEAVAAAEEEAVTAAEEELVAAEEEALAGVPEGELIGDAEPLVLQEEEILGETSEEMILDEEAAPADASTPETGEELLIDPEETVAEDSSGLAAAPGMLSTAEQETTEEPAATPVAPTEPVAEPGPVAASQPVRAEKKSFLQLLTTDTTIMGSAVAVVVVLLALLWAVVSRRKSTKAEFQESILVNTMDREDSAQAMEGTEPVSQTTEETSFLSDFSPSDIDSLQDETGEVDPVAEADVYIAYGRYNQAEELIRQALEKDPDRAELKQKLFEVMYATKDADGFTALAEEVASDGMQQKDPVGWEKVVSMGAKLAPTVALFSAAAAVETGKSAAIEDDVAALEQELSAMGELDLEDLANGVEGEEAVMESLDELDDLDLSDLSAEEEGQEPAGGGLDFDLDLGLTEAEKTSTDSTIEPQQADEVLDLGSLEEDLEGEDLGLDLEVAAAESQSQEPGTGDTPEPEVSAELELPAGEEMIGEELELPVLDFEADASEASAETPELPAVDEAAEEMGAGIDELMAESELVASLDEKGTGTDELAADEVNTKLDLARAYVDMGDAEGARSILDEVLGEGSEGQKEEAEQLLQALP